MIVIFPWGVDVARDRWPVMNWLIMAVTIAVFSLQVRDFKEYRASHTRDAYRQGPQTNPTIDTSRVPSPADRDAAPGITGRLMLRGWHLTGLLGHIWLHGGLLHLLGNMWFLWIFGNAVCSKVGNVRYLLLYVLLGVVAAASHLLCDGDPALGASGAINGVVGMYLVLFYENEITCLFALWLLLPIYIRWFAVSSIWIILLWLFWDIVGALWGSSGVGYFAHLGGFAGGFGITMLMCAQGWITMERYEKSLLQAWRERRGGGKHGGFDPQCARLGISMMIEDQTAPSTARAQKSGPIPLPEFKPSNSRRNPSSRTSIRTVCACGRDIKVSQQYAGRTVRCPACGQPVVIPQQTDFFGPAMQEHGSVSPPAAQGRDHSIRFACSCGKKIRVPAKYAGRSGKCPQCGSRLRIPPATA